MAIDIDILDEIHTKDELINHLLELFVESENANIMEYSTEVFEDQKQLCLFEQKVKKIVSNLV